MTDLNGKLAVVTGASRGIGYHAAIALAKAGAHVIAIARTVGGLEELDDAIQAEGGSATLVPLDLTDFDAVDRLGASIHERWGKLDILVGNAGMLGGLSPIEHFEPKTFDQVFALNVTANWRIMRSFSPLLRQAADPRVVFLTSSTADGPRAFWGLYAASHSALQTLVTTWATETQKTKMRINLLDPGPVRTALRAQAMPGEDTNMIAEPEEVCDAILALCDPEVMENGKIYLRTEGKFT